MCGIIGAVAQRDVADTLLEGLKHLEYRGYDSAGIVVIDSKQHLQCHRILGKVDILAKLLSKKPLFGHIGLAHTRWATHGKPSKSNAHPHIAGNEIALVHNGIIENHKTLRVYLLEQGCVIRSETDSELVAHLVYLHVKAGQDFMTAVRSAAAELQGAFSIGFIRRVEPERLLAIRNGSPLVVGLGIKENFIASDPMALASVANKFIYLEDGDIADVRYDSVAIYDASGKKVERSIHSMDLKYGAADKKPYPHFILKEILEQPETLTDIFEEYLSKQHPIIEAFGAKAQEIFPHIKRVQIVACGTSYHAGLVGRYWLEELTGIPCQVEIASENRYRVGVVEPDTLFVTLSQSGETADTLAAERQAKKLGYAATLTICNVPNSTLSRESDLVFMMRAGSEIGVASTKSFTSQLVALFLLSIALGRYHYIDEQQADELIKLLKVVPEKVEQVLKLDSSIQALASKIFNTQHIVLLARDIQFPIAMEGALKLKEIAYIHADAYPAGELKHGPLALVNSKLFVIALVPTNALLDKFKSNLQEVLARDGNLIVFTDIESGIENNAQTQVLTMPLIDKYLAPIIYAIPMQLLAYHIGILKGNDVDQPRNLAKSVTVE